MTRTLGHIGCIALAGMLSGCAVAGDDPQDEAPVCDDGAGCLPEDSAEAAVVCSSEAEAGAPEVLIAPRESSVSEGETASYTVQLGTRPCAMVDLSFAGSEDLHVQTRTMRFFIQDWDVPKTLTVEAVQDARRDATSDGTFVYSVRSNDSGYAALGTATVTMPILDRAPLWHISRAEHGTSANAASMFPSVSDDGRFVVFSSAASNLVLADAGGQTDVFLRDTVSDTTTRITQGPQGGANAATERAVISADGTQVAFVSAATNLGTSAPDADSQPGDTANLYMYTRTSGETTRLAATCSDCSLAVASGIALSADGSTLAYAARPSLAEAGGAGDHASAVFVIDTATQVVRTVSENDSDDGVSAVTTSSSGKHVGFVAKSVGVAARDSGATTVHTYTADVTDGRVRLVSTHSGGSKDCDSVTRSARSSAPHISADGVLAAFDSDCQMQLESWQSMDRNGLRDVYIRNSETQKTIRASIASDGTEANGDSWVVGLSDNSRYVVFLSDASNLVPHDDNDATDVFVRDLWFKETTLVSVGSQWQSIDEGVLDAAVSRNGRYVVFTTRARLANTDDNEGIADIYLRQLW